MRRLSSVLLVAFLTIISMRAHAQTVDTAIGGVVADSTGAVIPGATVIITNPATSQQKKAVTSGPANSISTTSRRATMTSGSPRPDLKSMSRRASNCNSTRRRRSPSPWRPAAKPR